MSGQAKKRRNSRLKLITLQMMADRKPTTVKELTSKAGKVGGKARMSALSEEERSQLGRKGGRLGGKARAAKLTPEQRSEIARNAARARWAKKKKAEQEDTAEDSSSE